MTLFIFTGRIHPERTGLTLPKHSRPLHKLDGTQFGTLQVEITASQYSALLQTNEKFEDILTAKNAVLEFSKVPVNAFTFTKGVGYRVEITKGICIDTGEIVTFGVGTRDFMQYVEEHLEVSEEDVMTACDSKHGRYLQYALEDISDAIGLGGRNSPFLCFRAIESLRHFIAEKNGIDFNNRAETWNVLRESSETSRDEIEYVKDFADKVRHGDSVEWQPVEILQIYKVTWGLIQKIVLLETKKNS